MRSDGAFTARRAAAVLVPAAAGAAAAVVASACVGAGGLSASDLADVLAGGGTDVQRAILHEIRLPRIAAGAIAGAGLAASGAACQTLLRNPLADPYILGVSAGGTAGAVLSVVLGAGSAPAVRAAAALAGCVAAVFAVRALCSGRDGHRPSRMLLAGIVVNLFAAAVISAAQYLATPGEASTILRWMMGGLDGVSWRDVLALSAAVPLGIAALCLVSPGLHAISFGDDAAASVGVDVPRVRRVTWIATAGVTAATVAVAGPVGFVGLVVPHLVRGIAGGDARMLVPAAAFAGAAVLVAADAAARTIAAPRELPAGLVTALLGAPALAALLLARRAREEGIGG